MASDARLLVGFTPESSDAEAVARELPGIPWVSAEEAPVELWRPIEAMLLGNARRELPNWKPADTPRLRFVQCMHTGLDNFPFARFDASVAIAGNVGAYAPFVAERAVALLLEAGHRLGANHAAVRAGVLRPAVENHYLAGSRVVILGFGAIGAEVARRVGAAGAIVEAVTRSGARPEGVARAYAADQLTEAVAAADAVIECRPLTNATRGTIDARVLGAMRPDAVFVNIGRAGTVDEAALYERLRRTPTFTAALDVWWSEDYASGRLRTDHPFVELPNFLGTPHNAALGPGATERGFRTALTNLRRFFDGEVPRSLADRREYS